jgi:hypothetical protein
MISAGSVVKGATFGEEVGGLATVPGLAKTEEGTLGTAGVWEKIFQLVFGVVALVARFGVGFGCGLTWEAVMVRFRDIFSLTKPCQYVNIFLEVLWKQKLIESEPSRL